MQQYLKDISEKIVKAFSECSIPEEIIVKSLLDEKYKKTGEYNAIINGYNELANLKEKADLLRYEDYLSCEPAARHVIGHYFFLEKQALLSIMPIILNCYMNLEIKEEGNFDADIPLYTCLVKGRYGKEKIWNESQLSAICTSLGEVLSKRLSHDHFDDSLLCTFLMLDDNFEVEKTALRMDDDNQIITLKNFFNKLLPHGEKELIDFTDLMRVIMKKSLAVPLGDDGQDIREKIIKERGESILKMITNFV